jgi:hypothetical protein
MGIKFEIRGTDLLCVKYNNESVEWKLAEIFLGEFEFEDIEFLNEIHATNLITEQLLLEARRFVTEQKSTIVTTTVK